MTPQTVVCVNEMTLTSDLRDSRKAYDGFVSDNSLRPAFIHFGRRTTSDLEIDTRTWFPSNGIILQLHRSLPPLVPSTLAPLKTNSRTHTIPGKIISSIISIFIL